MGWESRLFHTSHCRGVAGAIDFPLPYSTFWTLHSNETTVKSVLIKSYKIFHVKWYNPGMILIFNVLRTVFAVSLVSFVLLISHFLFLAL